MILVDARIIVKIASIEYGGTVPPMKMMSKIVNLYDSLTLKRRIILLFLCSCLIPFIFVGIISYHTIYSILSNKIQDSIQGNLKQVELSLESALGNLNHVSQQLAFKGTVGKKLDILLSSDQPFERSQVTNELMSELNLITFTNPGV